MSTPKKKSSTDDLLAPLPTFAQRHEDYSPSNTHLKTYTAGEDQGRLAEMAKQFGLEKHRSPRKQVRNTKKKHRRSSSYYNSLVHVLKDYTHDYTVEDARMRAVWTSHEAILDDEPDHEAQLYSRLLKSWQEGIGYEEEESDEEQVEVEMDHHGKLGSNLTSAVLGIIKGMVGPAILYLPHAFAKTGYALALPIMAVTTIVFLFSSTCLMDSWILESSSNSTASKEQEISSSPPRTLLHEEEPLRATSNDDYGTSVGKKQQPNKATTMLSYPELAYRALGSRGESMVKLGIALMQSGVCLTYLIFVPQNLHSCFLMLFGWNVSPSWWLSVMVLIQIPLSWIRDIRKLTATNLLANSLILYGLLICLGFALQQAGVSPNHNVDWYDSFYNHLKALSPFQEQWFLFIGTSVLLFEGSITLLVPLQEAVQGPDRAKFPSVYKRVILAIICFEAFFGVTCWMGFGNDVRTVLTVSLPSGYLATSVQFAYSVAVVFTFPLQNFPALEIACRSITSMVKNCSSGGSRRGRNSRGLLYKLVTNRNFQSSVLVCLLSVVAICTMDSLDKVVSLMGSLLGCPIAFCFPPLIHSRLDPNISPLRKFTNYLVFGIGVLAMVAASFTTLATWNDK